MQLKVKRIDEPATQDDGKRIFVERVWPKSLKPDEIKVDAWMKELAPSNPLRLWLSLYPKRWSEFCQLYYAELDSNLTVVADLIAEIDSAPVTLLYSAKSAERNIAVALRDYLRC